MKYRSAVIYIYNSFADPLFQNIVLQYLKTLNCSNRYKLYLITYEQKEFAITDSCQLKFKLELEQFNIYWHPLKFHTGRFILAKKIYDFIRAIFLVGYFKTVKRAKLIFAFANISGSFSYIFSRLFRMNLLIYSYEPHSDFLCELGVWSKKSLKYKALNWLEWYVGIHAEYVLTGTKHMVERLSPIAKGKVIRAPTSVDEKEFIFSEFARETLRKKLNVKEEQWIVVYIGKFGGLYYEKELIDFFGGLTKLNKHFYFIVATNYCLEKVDQWFEENEIDKSTYFLSPYLSKKEVIAYLSAADIGVSAIPPTPSQKYRSPTKIAEYLLCGLPYITCKNVSEDDEYALNYEVGVVVNNFSKTRAEQSISDIKKIVQVPKHQMVERCRSVGLSYRNKAFVDQTLTKIFEDVFL